MKAEDLVRLKKRKHKSQRRLHVDSPDPAKWSGYILDNIGIPHNIDDILPISDKSGSGFVAARIVQFRKTITKRQVLEELRKQVLEDTENTTSTLKLHLSDVVEKTEKSSREAYEELFVRHEATKTQLAEEQKTTNVYVQKLEETIRQRDDLLDTFTDLKQSNIELTKLLEEKESGQLLMFQALKGTVRDSFGDSVVVAYETEDDIIEHTYERQQFLGGEVPSEGATVKVCFYLSSRAELQDSALDGSAETDNDLIDVRVHRKNLIDGSDTF